MDSEREIVLEGGTTNRGLVTRLGPTVRRPRRTTSPSTRALLDFLRDVGFTAAPCYLGIDGRGREVLSYIPGEVPIAPPPSWALGDRALISVSQLLRRYHDAAAGFDPRGYDWPHPLPERFRGGLVSHNDPNRDNIVFRGGRAVALIDFDLASPGCAAWDLACAARLWVPLRDDFDVPPQLQARRLERLRLFVDAYGATALQRAQLVDALVECHRWCYDIIEDAASNGHPAFDHDWRNGGREGAERTRRWLQHNAARLNASLSLPT